MAPILAQRINEILVVAILLSIVAINSASSRNIVDEREPTTSRSVPWIATLICNPDNEVDKPLISRVSTILELTEFLGQVAPDNFLAPCKNRHLPVLVRLTEVVIRGNENVCGDEKISLIESFHSDYLSTNKHDVAERDSDQAEIPRILARFFMDYAIEVATACSKNVVYNLRKQHKEFRLPENLIGDDGSDFAQLLAAMGTEIPALNNVGSLDDVILVWDLAQNAMASEISEGEVDELTGEPVRMYIKVKDAYRMNSIKAVCKTFLRPVYSKVIVPVVRLANLGYEVNSDEVQNQIEKTKSIDAAKGWYGATQLCEAILPIKFVEDATMDTEKIFILNAREAAKYKAPEVVADLGPTMEFEPQTNSFENLDKLTMMTTSQKIIKNLNLGLSIQARALRRASRRAFKDVKKYLKAEASKIFVSSDESGSHKHVDFSHIMDDSEVSEEELEEMARKNPPLKWSKFVSRLRGHREVKRSTMGKILKVLQKGLVLTCKAIYLAAKVAFYLVTAVVALICTAVVRWVIQRRLVADIRNSPTYLLNFFRRPENRVELRH